MRIKVKRWRGRVKEDGGRWRWKRRVGIIHRYKGGGGRVGE